MLMRRSCCLAINDDAVLKFSQMGGAGCPPNPLSKRILFIYVEGERLGGGGKKFDASVLEEIR